MNLRIDGQITGEIDCKRLYLGCSLVSNCPKCQQEINIILGPPEYYYLSYPKMNKKQLMHFYCSECQEAWDEFFVLKVDLIPIDPLGTKNLSD